MTSEEFVKAFYVEKEGLLDLYISSNSNTHVGAAIRNLNLTEEQMTKLKTILDGVLTDMCYTILLGLDGAAQIGGTQETYKIYDEKGNELTGGEIEGYVWEYFQTQNG
jgi:hypothetical protein